MTRVEKTKKTTIYDLAELTGVSASAVSAILNGNWKKRRISASLAEKVTRIAQEQGYAVNRQASLLRSKKSNVIGMIGPKYDNRYFGSIAEKFEEMARDSRNSSWMPPVPCSPGRLTGSLPRGRHTRTKLLNSVIRRAYLH